jgi:hypothetical protein
LSSPEIKVFVEISKAMKKKDRIYLISFLQTASFPKGGNAGQTITETVILNTHPRMALMVNSPDLV